MMGHGPDDLGRDLHFIHVPVGLGQEQDFPAVMRPVGAFTELSQSRNPRRQMLGWVAAFLGNWILPLAIDSAELGRKDLMEQAPNHENFHKLSPAITAVIFTKRLRS